MTRLIRSGCWLAVLIGVPGCADSMAAVLRDHYNVQHEVLDNMSQIADDESAKRFNDAYRNRLKVKEDAVKERFDKIKNNQFTEADRKILEAEILTLRGSKLKGQIESLDARFRIMQNWTRRMVVKLAEDKAEEARKRDQSFTIKSSELCPNLAALEMPVFFNGGDLGADSGGGGMLMMGNPMMGGGMAGIGGPPGMGGPPGGPGGQAAAAPAGPKLDAKANQNLQFFLECRRTEDPGNRWVETRTWKSGGATITRLEVNGIDLVPLYSSQ